MFFLTNLQIKTTFLVMFLSEMIILVRIITVAKYFGHSGLVRHVSSARCLIRIDLVKKLKIFGFLDPKLRFYVPCNSNVVCTISE